MLKLKTSRTQLYNYYNKEDIFSVGYCELQNLLKAKDANAYTCGAYGWNADVYFVGAFAIVTGYRPCGTDVDYTIIKRYDNAAKNVWACQGLTYHQKMVTCDKMLLALVMELYYKTGGAK